MRTLHEYISKNLFLTYVAYLAYSAYKPNMPNKPYHPNWRIVSLLSVQPGL